MLNSLSFDHARPAYTGGSPTAAVPPESKLRKAAEEFEAYFIQQILKQMQQTSRVLSSADDAMPVQGHNDEMLTIAHMAIANTLAKNHSFGIANIIEAQLARQEATTAAQSGNSPHRND